MGLELKLAYEIIDCSSIIIKDITGFYNSVTNITGWGSPNLAKDFTGTAVLKITNSIDDSVEEIDVKTIIEESIFPQYVLTTFTPEKLVDGLYYITLTLDDTENVYTYQGESIAPVYCNIKCCVYKKASEIADELCNQNCNSPSYVASDIAITYYNSLCIVAKDLGEQEFLKILKQLKKLCNQYTDKNCGCGCGGNC